MIIPPYLKRGDTVAIAAPARKISLEEIRPAVHMLQEASFNVYYDDRLFAQQNQFAGDEQTRAGYIQELLDSPAVNAIWFARGGYGSARIIDLLDFSAFKQHPKWLVGYSDITVFHAHINKNYDIATLHATMPINVHEGEREIAANQSLLAALTGQPLHYKLYTHPLNKPGYFEAPIIGGNLSVLYSLMGSPSDIDTDGKILFIEDLDEYLYHIDRMMTNLERSGKLDHLAGLIVGHMSDMHDNTIPYGKTAEEIVAEHCARHDFPVIFNFPAGHEADNRAIRLGCPLRGFLENNYICIDN
ncbi:MAG: LD-carboxypeptidase [Bacteroidales bacterium]|nr:LD-carboxypeptidase [Bacteroidales bacterium]